jgi:aldehyde dehydrogenase (NAD+)
MTIVEEHASRAQTVLPEPALLIGDELIHTTSSGTLEVEDPTTGAVLAEFPAAGQEEVDRAVAAAKAAFPAWKRFPADQRRNLMFRCAQAIAAHGDELNTIQTLENGTPIAMSSIAAPVDYFEYYAGFADKFEGELIAAYPQRAFNYVRYEPYGVIGVLPTWNGPLINAAMKIAPAIAAGNTVVLRSPETAPLAILRLSQILLEVGLPAGVLNVITGGPETATAIIRHPDVRKVTYTGSPEVAAKIMSTASESLTPVTLELGGKSANLVFDDADLDRAVQHATMTSVVLVAGQGCLFPTRLFVQDTIYDEVIDRVKAMAESSTIGDPLDPTTIMGPVINKRAVDRILGYVDGARGDARLVCGGQRLGGDLAGGYFLQPTVLADVDNRSRIAQEEVFGPVLAIMPFHTEEEALAKANDSRYGLAGYVHTRDLERAHRVADELDAGLIGINGFPSMQASAPFGGVKHSGFGREGGRAGIEEFVHHKQVWMPLS